VEKVGKEVVVLNKFLVVKFKYKSSEKDPLPIENILRRKRRSRSDRC